MDFLMSFGVIVDFDTGAIRFKALGNRTYLLERSRCGHLLIDVGPEAEWREVITREALISETTEVAWAQEGFRETAFATDQLSRSYRPAHEVIMRWQKLTWLLAAA